MIELHDCAAALTAQILQALIDCKKKIKPIVTSSYHQMFFFLFGGLKKAGKVTQILERIQSVQQGIRTPQVRRPQVEKGLTRVACRGITQLLLNVYTPITLPASE